MFALDASIFLYGDSPSNFALWSLFDPYEVNQMTYSSYKRHNVIKDQGIVKVNKD